MGERFTLLQTEPGLTGLKCNEGCEKSYRQLMTEAVLYNALRASLLLYFETHQRELTGKKIGK